MKKLFLGKHALLLMLTIVFFMPRVGDSAGKLPTGFADVSEVMPTVPLDIRYFGFHNFLGVPVDGYSAPKCILTREAAAALAKVQNDLASFSLSLKIYDCYRPQRAVNHFVRWAKDVDDTKTKAEFYPTLDKRDLFAGEYIATRSGHSRGSTVDLTIIALPASLPAPYQPGEKLYACYLPQAQRFPDNGLDMGTGFDCFHELSHTVNNKVGEQQRLHRLLLKTVMEKQGFKNYEKEWWHFTLRDEPFPQTYFDFAIE